MPRHKNTLIIIQCFNNMLSIHNKIELSCILHSYRILIDVNNCFVAIFMCPENINTGQSFHADPTDCHFYYHCSKDKIARFQCGPGTAFSEQLKVCDHEYNVHRCGRWCMFLANLILVLQWSLYLCLSRNLIANVKQNTDRNNVSLWVTHCS